MENNELIETIEAIRAKLFPEIPKELLEKIINTEGDFMEQPVEAYKRVADLVEHYLANDKEI
ncbi:MAG: hypothetical protein K9K33_18300 [Desulfarculaceae bacterium]|nr:hypothetical protein [Desulfarculaceae bacterium]